MPFTYIKPNRALRRDDRIIVTMGYLINNHIPRVSVVRDGARAFKIVPYHYRYGFRVKTLKHL